MIVKKTVILLVLLCLASCTHRSLYDNMRHNQRDECLKTSPSDYDACLESTGVNKSYEQYRRERDALLEQRSQDK